MNEAETQMVDAATLMLRRTYSADIETVFNALTKAEAIKAWFGPGAMKVTHSACDLRVGGRWVIEMLTPEGNMHNVGGEYIEIDRPRSVKFTWAWQFEPDEVSEVTYRLKRINEGSTLFTLIHSRLPSENSRDLHGQGWNKTLDNLGPWLAP